MSSHGPILQNGRVPVLRRKRLAVALAGLLIGCMAATIGWWFLTRLPKPRLIGTLQGTGAPVDQVLFSPDGNSIATSGDGSLKLWDAKSLALRFDLNVITLDKSVYAAFSPDSTMVATGSYRTVQVWDVSSGAQLGALNAHDDFITAVSFYPDGTKLVSGGHDGVIKIWDVASGKLLDIVPQEKDRVPEDAVTFISISPDSHTLAWIGRDRKTVRIWSIESRQEIRRVHHSYSTTLTCLAFSGDSASLAGGHRGESDPAVTVWDVKTGVEQQSYARHSGDVNSLSFSPNGHMLVLGCGGPGFPFADAGKIEIIDLRTGLPRARWKAHDRWATSAGFSSDGETLISGSHDGTIKLWDITNFIN